MADNGRKLIPLEGLRGIAAAIVVLYHLVLAFTPKGVGVVPHGHGALDIFTQFILGMLNGGAAVAVFFVLSGFILSLPFARDRRVSRVLVALLKRWPRLACLTMIACLFAFVLISWSGHEYKAAAHVIGAKWLATHGNAPIRIEHLTWDGALREGLVNVFTQGEVKFDSPLWTMRIELFGSFAIFLSAPILFAIGSWSVRLGLVALAFYVTGTGYPFTFFADFLTGTVLAMLFAEEKLPELGNQTAFVLGGLGLYLFSFTYEQALLIHAPLKFFLSAVIQPLCVGCRGGADHHRAARQPSGAAGFFRRLGGVAGAALLPHLSSARADFALRRVGRLHGRGGHAWHGGGGADGGFLLHPAHPALRPAAGLGG